MNGLPSQTFYILHVSHIEICLILIASPKKPSLGEPKQNSKLLLTNSSLPLSFLFPLGFLSLTYFFLWLEEENKYLCWWVAWRFGVFCQQHRDHHFPINSGYLSPRGRLFLMPWVFSSVDCCSQHANNTRVGQLLWCVSPRVVEGKGNVSHWDK